MSRKNPQPSLKRTTSTGAYGVNLDSEPSPPRQVPAIHLAHQGRDWSPHNMFVPDPNPLRRQMRRNRGLPHTDSSLHLSERAHQALGLERRLATSPTRSDAEESPAQRKPFVNLSDEDGSHSETDRGHAPADSSPDSDDDSHSSSSDEGLLMSSRPQLGRAQTWTHGSSSSQALEPPRAHSSSDSDDESDDDDALVMAPVRRRSTAPGPSSSSTAAAAAAASSGRRGRPPPLKKDAFVPRPRDGPKSPSTTRQDGEPAYGTVSSAVNEETKKQRRNSFDKALRRRSRR